MPPGPAVARVYPKRRLGKPGPPDNPIRIVTPSETAVWSTRGPVVLSLLRALCAFSVVSVVNLYSHSAFPLRSLRLPALSALAKGAVSIVVSRIIAFAPK